MRGQQAPPKYLTESAPAGSVWCGARSAASDFQISNVFVQVVNIFDQTVNVYLFKFASYCRRGRFGAVLRLSDLSF